MDALDQPSLLSIPARLLESEGLSDRRRDAWRILFSDSRLFQERRVVVDGVEEVFYDLVDANLIPLIAKECRESKALWALERYCEARRGMESAADFLESSGVEQGVAQRLPQEPAGGETLRSAVLRTAVAQARIAGRDQFLTQLQDHLHESGITGERAGSWQGALLSFEEAGKQKKTVFMLTISTETGTLTMGPARDLNHKETQVIDLADGRRPIGFFVGGDDGEVFHTLLGRAVVGWLQGEDGETSEKTALREAWNAWLGDKRKGETLDDCLQRGDKASNQRFFQFLTAQGKEHSMSPIQAIAGFGGDIHLGNLPEGVLSRLLEQGRKLTGVITQPDGSQTEVALGHFPDEAEGKKLVEQHSRTWTAENRKLRLEMIRQSEQELHQGSIGFLKIMKGSVNLGEDEDGGSWIRGGVEGDIGNLLETIEAHYSREERDGPPAGLKDLCERFLSDANVPEEKQSMLREAMASYNDKMGVAERNDFYRKVATYMVDRFGQGIKGAKRDELILGLDTLVGAAARTRFMYVVTDPATGTTKVGIAGNLSERIDALGKENGTMVVVACYAIKSIPVVQWSTDFMDFLAGSETSREDGSSIVARGKVGASTEAERVARARWANLGRRFGYSRDGETKTPDSMVEFLCGGVHRMIAEDGLDLAEFIVPYGDDTGKNEVARAAARETVKARVFDFLKNKFQADGAKDPGHIIPQVFLSSMAELWIATHGNIAFGDATTQRACISSLNGALSALFSTGGRADEATRIKRALDAGAELIAPEEGGIDSDTLNKISRYGEHLGAKACEWDIHQSLASLRMGKSEMFYVGANYPEFLSIIEKRMGQGVVGRRYLMGRPGRDGDRARRAKETLSMTVQPNRCMQWRQDGRNVLSKLAAVGRQRPEIVDLGRGQGVGRAEAVAKQVYQIVRNKPDGGFSEEEIRGICALVGGADEVRAKVKDVLGGMGGGMAGRRGISLYIHAASQVLACMPNKKKREKEAENEAIFSVLVKTKDLEREGIRRDLRKATGEELTRILNSRPDYKRGDKMPEWAVAAVLSGVNSPKQLDPCTLTTEGIDQWREKVSKIEDGVMLIPNKKRAREVTKKDILDALDALDQLLKDKGSHGRDVLIALARMRGETLGEGKQRIARGGGVDHGREGQRGGHSLSK